MIYTPIAGSINLAIGTSGTVRFDVEASLGKPGMAIGAESLIVTTNTGLGIILGLDRVDADKVSAMVFGNIVALERLFAQINVNAAASVALVTKRLVVAVGTVSASFACCGTMISHPITVLMMLSSPVIIVGQRDPLLFMTCVAILEWQVGVLFM